MQRMIDLIRKSAVSATVMQAAARGALMIPAEEMVEILVHLANHNKIFGTQARMRLASWDLKSAIEIAGNLKTSEEVLGYMAAEDNLRPGLLPALLENPSVPEAILAKLARSGSREVVKMMAASPRATKSPSIRKALADNPNSSEAVSTISAEPVHEPDESLPVSSSNESEAKADEEGMTSPQVEQAGDADPELDQQIAAFMSEHASEIAAEGNKPFQPVGGIEVLELTAKAETSEPAPAPTANAAAAQPAKAAAGHAPKPYHARPEEGVKRDSTLQKIAKLDIKGRIQLAMKGSKEERSILVRDGTKIVALAVLDSPKITDGEVEGFASQKNVLEAVLRGIPMKRRFAKHYPVVRNLVFNPRTPIDLSLSLMKNLLVNDLKNLSGNKEVSETIRKLALKMFKQKMEPGKHG